MERPNCPDPAHAGGRVVRAGWYGKKPHRRQRWKCEPPNGDPAHRFTETLPRKESGHSHCLECSTHLEPWEGQPAPRTYSFTAREIAQALKLVANGYSYRQAAAETRRLSGRILLPKPRRGSRRRQFRRDPNLEGGIVANWVDVFTPLLEQAAPTHWPKTVLVDSTNFRIAGGLKGGMGYNIFVAIGHESPGARPEVVHMQAFPRKDAHAWAAFFRALQGTPEVIVTDMDAASRYAADRVFPRVGGQKPEMRMCEWHLKRSIETGLALLQSQPTHPVWAALKRAFYSPAEWARFEAEVERAHLAGQPRLDAMTRWLKKNGEHVEAQVATRRHGVPNSIGAVEGTLSQLNGWFGNQKRASVFGNQARMNKLLGLMTLEFRGQADELEWAETIRLALLPRGGQPELQRQWVDQLYRPSLVA